MITKLFVEVTYQLLADIHTKIIETSGGEQGIRDEGGLYNSVYRILRYEEIHSDAASRAAFIYKELARRHHFNDGNKRTAHVFAKITLFSMGRHFKIEYEQAVPFIMDIASFQSKITFKEIKNWVASQLIGINKEDMENYLKKLLE